MTVKQLREKLKKYLDSLLVVMSRDPEGNGYSPADATFAAGEYNRDRAEFYHHPEDKEYRKGPDNALCIWPKY